jgi:hypothetical protein
MRTAPYRFCEYNNIKEVYSEYIAGGENGLLALFGLIAALYSYLLLAIVVACRHRVPINKANLEGTSLRFHLRNAAFRSVARPVWDDLYHSA